MPFALTANIQSAFSANASARRSRNDQFLYPATASSKANDNNNNKKKKKQHNTSTHNVATTTHHRYRGMSSRQRRSNVAVTPGVSSKFRNTVVNIIISNNCFNLNVAPDNLTKLCHNAATTMSDCAGSSLPQSWFSTCAV